MNKDLVKVIVSFIILVIVTIFNFNNEFLSILLYVISYVIVGYEIIFKALKNIFRGNFFDENFLMSLATIGAIFIGSYGEAVAVMLFYQVGELFQNYAVNKSRKAITSLMNIRPDYANLKNNDNIEKVEPGQVKIGDTIVIKPGEKVPLDGKVILNSSMLDMSALTGESVPKEINVGDEILSGCINISGVIEVEVTKSFGESTVTKILDLVENSSSKKSNSENFITKFAKYYTPIVVLLAVLIALLPPLLFQDAVFSDWIYRALSFLVVSCPCALVISIPLGFFGGIGGASKIGVLVKGSNYLEALADSEIFVFDKTGTLTKGVFEVQQINSVSLSKEELLKYAVYAESHSTHPISQSLKKAYNQEINQKSISTVNEIAGHGIVANIDSHIVAVGNEKLMKKMNISYEVPKDVGTIVYIAIDNNYSGNIVISDVIKDDSKDALIKLKQEGIRKTVMLTGDSNLVATNVGNILGIDEVYSELLPVDKVDILEKLFKEILPKSKLVFVGDGINDAPVLARADIGIAMGGLGSDAAIEAADIVIMTDELSKIIETMKISKKTLRIVRENIWVALIVKGLVLILSALGISTMWQAVFADVGVSIIAIINSLRALKI